ncbi:TonB-dependent receptor family protein [Phocaeicola barnesiae]|jgi:iron complex outermembrane receptor protein|uniref:outer membrane beta-barrel family protein n=1 Tax=Phocaeicola barnesiae TaxID=376804 RepID=UPI001F41E0DF|nr:outer membrane beta-barrel family protein [Phocaeicola barnesiae]MCF2577258.1 TonB-dependent receptor family protein [Phocaeicola barnesiae]MDM8242928.1 outer membrane beta-barrel family protein [Phocaeicola barnesiae]MDM8255543.1 outer membrane beta-barrel family protein [Phocaeicola barnesiae]MDM8310410.1 outer membrane beta-barrel family protein [Phocaeicola barnesiae]
MKLSVLFLYEFVKTSVLLVFCWLSCIKMQGQDIEIRGNVSLSGGTTDIYNVLALRADSSIYKGSVCMEKQFLFSLELDSIESFRISSLGYSPVDFGKKQLEDRMKNNIVDLGNVCLSADLTLDEVVVTGVRKRIEISPTGYSVDIKNSYLSDLGHFADVISRIPGISVAPRGKIEVIGKQNPLFVLNGRQLHSPDELQRLDPKNIKTIYVDYSPGPEYDTSYDAVVRIETNDKNQEYYSGSFYNQFEYGRKASNYMQAVVDAKSGNVSYSLDMQYNHSNFEQYDTESKSVWRGEDIVSAERTGSLQGPTNNVVVAPTMQWNINDRNKLEAIYRMEHSYNDSRQIQQFTEDVLGEKKAADTRLSDEIKRTAHNPSLFYTYKTGEHSLRISADYYRMNTKNMQEAKEMYNDGQINTNLQDFNDKYEIFGGAVDYFASLKGWGISAGGKVSAISDNGYYLTNEIDASSSKLNDNTYALYAGLSKSFADFSLSTALRAEFNTVNYRNSAYSEPVEADFFNLFPSLSAIYRKDKLSLSLSYNRKIKRPTFSQLNPNQRYMDPVSYIAGNPLLRSQISDNISFQFSHSNFVFITYFKHLNNPFVGISELTEDNKIWYKDVNIPHMKELDLMAVYSFQRNWFKSNFTFLTRFYDIKYDGEVYSRFCNTPMFQGRIVLDLDLWKGASLYLKGIKYWNMRVTTTEMRDAGYVSVELGQSFLNNRLRFTVGGMDLFKTYDSNTWVNRLSNSITYMNTDADSRYVYVTLQFKFGKMKSVQSSGSIITEEKERL